MREVPKPGPRADVHRELLQVWQSNAVNISKGFRCVLLQRGVCRLNAKQDAVGNVTKRRMFLLLELLLAVALFPISVLVLGVAGYCGTFAFWLEEWRDAK